MISVENKLGNGEVVWNGLRGQRLAAGEVFCGHGGCLGRVLGEVRGEGV